MEKRCPKCGLINPPDASRCDCGYDFTAEAVRAPPADQRAAAESVAARARASWVCPLVAWASQIVLHLTLRGVPGLGLMWLLVMLVQFALIIAGLYLGAKVLALGRRWVEPSSWRAALAGVALSGGTILLIVALALRESF